MSEGLNSLCFSLCFCKHFSLVKHTWLLPNICWQMFDNSQQVFCSCIAFWQYKWSLRRTIQMSKWVVIVKCMCHVSVSHLVQRVTLLLRGKLTPLLCSLKLFLSVSVQLTHQLTGTLIRCLCTCSCLLSDTRWSRLASKDGGAVTADTWLKKCCKYFASRYVLARWRSGWAFVVQQEATVSSDCGDGGRG